MAVKVKGSSKEDTSGQVKKIEKRKKSCRDNDDISAEEPSHHKKGARKKSRTSQAPEQNDFSQGEENMPGESVEHHDERCEDGMPELKKSKKKGKKCKKSRQQEEEPDKTSTRKHKHDNTKADEETADPVVKKKNKTIKLADCDDVGQEAFKNKRKRTGKAARLEETGKDQCGLDDASSEDPNPQGKKKKMKRKRGREELGDSGTLGNSHGLPDTNEDTGNDRNEGGVQEAVACKRKKKSKKSERQNEDGNQKELDIVKRRKKDTKGQLQSNSNSSADNLEQGKTKKQKRQIIVCDNAEDEADDVKAQKSKKRKTKCSGNTDAGEEDTLPVGRENQPRTKRKKKQSSANALDGEAARRPDKQNPRKTCNATTAASESKKECRSGSTKSKGREKHGKSGSKKKPDVRDNLVENKQTDVSQSEQEESKRSPFQKLVKKLGADAMDSDIIFVAIKPGHIEENFDLARRVELQTQVDIMTGKVSAGTNKTKGDGGGGGGNGCGDGCGDTGFVTARTTQFGQWDTASLGDAATQNKFLRLMGGFKKTSGHSASGLDSGAGESDRANMALSGESENRLNSALESQFQQALHRKNHQQRGVGLGFQADAGAKKMFFIDKSTSRSIKFD